MSNVELTYVNDVLEPKVEPPKTLAEQQRDALLEVLKYTRRFIKAAYVDTSYVDNAIAAVESGKVPEC